METLVGVFGKGIPKGNQRRDDDFTDRLSHRYSMITFVIFAIVLSTRQYVGEPICCWVPAHFTGNHEDYANSYCWIKNTYYLPFEEDIPKEEEHEKRQMITYYQWIPIILLVQALLCYLPVAIWRTLNTRAGIDIETMVNAGTKYQHYQNSKIKDQLLTEMSFQMHRYINSQDLGHSKGCTVSLQGLLSRLCCGRHQGNQLIMSYIFVKLLFLANAFGQLWVLDNILGTGYHAYGVDVIRMIANGEDWTLTSRFPRVTMCDFHVRRLGNVQRYTVQCVLSINLFNEKIYLLVWFWLVFLTGMTLYSLLQWIVRGISKSNQEGYIKKQLNILSECCYNVPSKAPAPKGVIEAIEGSVAQGAREEKRSLTQEEYDARVTDFAATLKRDGVFVMRLIGHNTNAITVAKFTCFLWDEYNLRRDDGVGESDGENHGSDSSASSTFAGS